MLLSVAIRWDSDNARRGCRYRGRYRESILIPGTTYQIKSEVKRCEQAREAPRSRLHGRRVAAPQVRHADVARINVSSAGESRDIGPLPTAMRDRAAGFGANSRLPGVRRTFYIGLGVAFVMQATGVNSIMYFGTQILTASGFGRQTALIANIANGAISVAATCVGIYLPGKMGRRPMLLAGFMGTTLSLLLIGLVSAFLPVSELRAYLILSSMVCFLGFMQGLIAPVSWMLLSELFPIRVRGFAAGMAGSVLWTVNCVIGLSSSLIYLRPRSASNAVATASSAMAMPWRCITGASVPSHEADTQAPLNSCRTGGALVAAAS
jgi:hypothetical protein